MDDLTRSALIAQFIQAMKTVAPGQEEKTLTKKTEELLLLVGNLAIQPVSRVNMINFLRKSLGSVVPERQLSPALKDWNDQANLGASPLVETAFVIKIAIMAIFSNPTAAEKFFYNIVDAKPAPVTCWDVHCIMPLT